MIGHLEDILARDPSKTKPPSMGDLFAALVIDLREIALRLNTVEKQLRDQKNAEPKGVQ